MGSAGLLAVIALIVATVLSLTSLAGGSRGGASGSGDTRSCQPLPSGPEVIQERLSTEQASNAAIVVTAGRRARVPSYGWVIAIATALRESDLVNRTTPAGTGALGLFHQRPSEGWGTSEQIADPEHAASAFYTALLRVDGWQTMSVTQASRSVARAGVSTSTPGGTAASTAGDPPGSADPSASADERFADQARSIVAAFTGGNGGSNAACDQVTVSDTGWSRPVPGSVITEFRPPEDADHHGIDFEAPRETVIRSAASGTIVTALCNIDGRYYSALHTPSPCDTDGSPNTGGCGWYLEIRHADGIISRYCHMVRAPAVAVGQTVSAGQPIGRAGTSGHSSKPHLHFEIHKGYPATSSNAADPIPFLADQGVAP
ncbi:MAG: M23 family metallopeptidase [Micromonosporaceae bacterium]|nr:M23 family metallopeptidase [Micromonosporaceae bacterium]